MYTMEPPKKGHFGTRAFGPCREVGLCRYCMLYLNEKRCGFKLGRSRRELSTEVQRSGAGLLDAGRSLEVAIAVVWRFKMC